MQGNVGEQSSMAIFDKEKKATVYGLALDLRGVCTVSLCVEILVWGIFPMISQTSISSRWYSVKLYKLHFDLYIYICMHVVLLSCSLYELQFVILAAHLSLSILGTREGQSARNSYKVEDIAFLDLKGLCL